MNIKIVPIRADFLQKARQAGLDDQNQPVQKMIAEGGEPCRDLLRRARPGEEILLASYCPFSKPGPYKEYGPIFIMANESNESPALTELPLPAGKGTGYLADSFILRAYSEDERIVDASVVEAENADRDISQLFNREVVSFILVRFVAYGCYGFRVERRQQ
ncbi:DUF1203 domain-containing protein [Kangiella shandongensis]|uniref:DUF1203 domain-containing protein n=1 Tax=Kangiella shandongensis TaxID=2763258 RepID=UPI001CBFD8C7|nr:DUF1203 domain-containing protein [Kangiella shandongensis]